MKHNRLYTLLGILFIIAVTAITAIYLVSASQKPTDMITSYDECVAAGHPVQESHPARCVVPNGPSFEQPASGQAVTVEGKVVCLPHKDTDGPQTLECAIGLQTNDGTYYALQPDKTDSSLTRSAGSNKKVRINGTIKQETSDRYQSKGIITVDDFEFL